MLFPRHLFYPQDTGRNPSRLDVASAVVVVQCIRHHCKKTLHMFIGVNAGNASRTLG